MIAVTSIDGRPCLYTFGSLRYVNGQRPFIVRTQLARLVLPLFYKLQIWLALCQVVSVAAVKTHYSGD